MPLSIQEAKAKHAEGLLEMPGVVSVGVGLDPEGRPAILVGLDGPCPETCAALPDSLEGYPLRTRVTGPAEALGRSLPRE
jgi:hypothetical protein